MKIENPLHPQKTYFNLIHKQIIEIISTYFESNNFDFSIIYFSNILNEITVRMKMALNEKKRRRILSHNIQSRKQGLDIS